jgi:hypothetical protein
MSSRKIFLYNPKIMLLKSFQTEQANMSWVMTINMNILSRAEAISLFRLTTSVRPLTFSAIASTYRVIIEDKREKMWKKEVVACFKVFCRNFPGLTVEY